MTDLSALSPQPKRLVDLQAQALREPRPSAAPMYRTQLAFDGFAIAGIGAEQAIEPTPDRLAAYRDTLAKVPEDLGTFMLPTALGDDGSVRVGKISFPSNYDYLRFVAEQINLQTPDAACAFRSKSELLVDPLDPPKPRVITPQKQAELLDQLTSRGLSSFNREISPQAGETIDSLLAARSAPTEAGFVNYGNLTLKADQADTFESTMRGLAANNPEAVAILGRMERSQGQVGLTFNDTGFGQAGGQHPAMREVASVTAVQMTADLLGATVDALNGRVVPGAVVMLHEMTHFSELSELAYDPKTGRRTMPTHEFLNVIPLRNYDNAEEFRVIEGLEQRALLRMDLSPRHSHHGSIVRAETPFDASADRPTVHEYGFAKPEMEATFL